MSFAQVRPIVSIYLSTNLYGSLKSRRRAQMVASTIAMMVSPNSMIKLGGHNVFFYFRLLCGKILPNLRDVHSR